MSQADFNALYHRLLKLMAAVTDQEMREMVHGPQPRNGVHRKAARLAEAWADMEDRKAGIPVVRRGRPRKIGYANR